ncbi:MAG: TAXI family TRAP transporter solute-binding subunit [Desulfobacteraceae bacterium]|nr:MAG: TAXI family TRAP transporter solute-binding subunit [Desulfobacteraceae bacterium]
MKMLKKISWLVILFSLVFVSSAQAAKVISVGTAPAGGTWYAIGGALADIITKHVEGVNATAEVTGAAVANVKLLGTKEIQIGLTINAIAKQGYEGRRPFKQKYTNIRSMISSFQKGYLQIFTLAGSDLVYVSELKGKRVAVGPAGHGSLIRLKEIFKTMGFSFDDIKPVYLPYGQSLRVLGDRKVDAAVLYMAPPVPAVKQFSVTNKVKLLRLKEENRKAILAKYPHYVPEVVPKFSYEGQDQSIPTVATANVILVDQDLEEQLVYNIVKAVFENIDKLRASHPSMKKFSLDMATIGSLVPFHPGAVKYYKEQGVWTGK